MEINCWRFITLDKTFFKITAVRQKMDKQINETKIKFAKSYRLLALIALVSAIFLSYFTYNILFNGQKIKYANKILSLPNITSSQNYAKPTDDNGWTVITAIKGDTLSTVFKRAGLSQKTLQIVIQNNKYVKTLTNIKPGQQIRLLIQNQILEKLITSNSATQFLVVSKVGNNYNSEIEDRKVNTKNNYLTATVRGSLYNTAKQMNIPVKLIQQMTDIFNWEIDFNKGIKSGDQFSIVYQADYIDGKMVNSGDIIAVTYINSGVTHEAIRHVSESGDYDYFTREGLSLKKAFSRYPIKFSHISSTFSLSRYHPILHYRRAHKGVDLAAPIGTPIYATGNGRIQLIERHSGYGNMIKISHNGNYSSLYAHLLKFQKGISRGSFVKRGQIIGYVGQSGLADGPHCHYEFHINNHPKNPSTVALPHSQPISKRELASFKANSNAILAQLKLYEESNLATLGKKSNKSA